MARTKQKDRRYWRLAGPLAEDQSSKKTCRNCTGNAPPHTLPPKAKALTRLFKRCDDMADSGVHISLSVACRDSRCELVGILVASPEAAAYAVDLMGDGVLIAEVGTAVQHA